MYALKKITVTTDGRQVEECHVLGNWYRLEQRPEGVSPEIIAQIEYADEKGGIPNISIHKTDEAYITLLNGETVRHVCRGDAAERKRISEVKRSASSISGTIRVHSAD